MELWGLLKASLYVDRVANTTLTTPAVAVAVAIAVLVAAIAITSVATVTLFAIAAFIALITKLLLFYARSYCYCLYCSQVISIVVTCVTI